MNYIKHLAGFFERVASDDRLNPTHISMYVSLFQFWNASRFQNPISISRNELMKVSKISAKATYHKCIRELNDYGYLQYRPSYNPFKGSLVYLFNFQAGSEQAIITEHTKNETSIEQAQEPYINNSNVINQTVTNKDKQAQKNDVQNLDRFGKKEKSSAKKESAFITPQLKNVREYFTSQKYPTIEAEKFFNYFQSNGWLVGGRTKMKDWQAAARNWILNSKKITTGKSVKPRAKYLHASTNKDYSEPL